MANFVARANLQQAVDLESGLELAGKDPAKIREVNLVLAAASKRTDVKSSQRHLLAYLATFSAADAATALPQAKEAALNAIRDPLSARDYEILHLAPIKALESADAPLHGLLKIVCTGTIHTLKPFVQGANNAVLAANNLKAGDIEDKMRVLSFTSLAATADSFSYQQAADAMDVPKKDVVTWVIRAISARVIECKLDEQAETIAVSSTMQRASLDEAAQWQAVAAQLKRWRVSVRGVLHTMETAREEQLAKARHQA